MSDIIELLLGGIMDILDGASGKAAAERDDRLKRAKSVMLVGGIVSVSIAAVVLLIWLLSRVIL